MKDINFKLDGLLPQGIAFDDWLSMHQDTASSMFQKCMVQRKKGSSGFWDLADNQDEVLAKIEAYTHRLQGGFKDVIVVGIGGSSLGPKALQTALGGRAQKRRLHFIDNSDPWTLGRVLEDCDLEDTLINVVTKSGGTSETIASAMILIDKLKHVSTGSDWKKQIVVTTDPENGLLRGIAQKEGFASFDIPQNVGGRFSVLSAVGLLPAALAGFDVKQILEGAFDMKERLTELDTAKELSSNPSLALASLLKDHFSGGRNLVVLMPYMDRLLDLCEWFKQLWGESIGKAKSLDGRAVHTGSTPMVFRGATDQHSQLQLYAEGPDDKVYLSMLPSKRVPSITIPPSVFDGTGGYNYLRNKKLSELIKAQHDGTMATLSSLKRPTATIQFDTLNEEFCGGLMMFFMVTTAMAGTCFGVDPFDQPGVEKAKKLAFAGLKREGYEEHGALIDAYKSSKSSFLF